MRIGEFGRRATGLLAFGVATLVVGSGRAEAQFGYGYGLFNFNYQPPEVGYIDKLSLQNASRATMGPVQNNGYANNPNSYFNQLHGDNSYDRYDVATRRSIDASIGRYSDGPPPSAYSRPEPPPASTSNAPRTAQPTTPAPAPAAPTQSWTLASYFDPNKRLVWPDEAPSDGEFKATRATSDQACLAVLNEYSLRGLASLDTVTDARAKLLDYGKPALKFVREHSTPRIADTFHMFLLSLYESLARAATVPAPNSGATPPQP